MAKRTQLGKLVALEPGSGVQDWRGEDGRHYFLTSGENGAPEPKIGLVGQLVWRPNPKCRGLNVWNFEPLPEGSVVAFHSPHKVKARLVRDRVVKNISVADCSKLMAIDPSQDLTSVRSQTWHVIGGPMKGCSVVMLDAFNGLKGAKVGDEVYLVLVKDENARTGENWRVKSLKEVDKE